MSVDENALVAADLQWWDGIVRGLGASIVVPGLER
jgi:hypothetical protein